MNLNHSNAISSKGIELGEILSSTIQSVVTAQEKLDRYTESRKNEWLNAEKGTMALPPLWYVFNNVSVELELSAKTQLLSPIGESEEKPHLVCNTLNPSLVSLYGREAAAGLRVCVELAPQGFLPVKETESNIVETQQ